MAKSFLVRVFVTTLLFSSTITSPIPNDKISPNETKIESVEATLDCEVDGKTYHNGHRIANEQNPCEDCHCVAGEVSCSVISCDSAPEGNCKETKVEGQCCSQFECSEDSEGENEISERENEVSDSTTVSSDVGVDASGNEDATAGDVEGREAANDQEETINIDTVIEDSTDQLVPVSSDVIRDDINDQEVTTSSDIVRENPGDEEVTISSDTVEDELYDEEVTVSSDTVREDSTDEVTVSSDTVEDEMNDEEVTVSSDTVREDSTDEVTLSSDTVEDDSSDQEVTVSSDIVRDASSDQEVTETPQAEENEFSTVATDGTEEAVERKRRSVTTLSPIVETTEQLETREETEDETSSPISEDVSETDSTPNTFRELISEEITNEQTESPVTESSDDELAERSVTESDSTDILTERSVSSDNSVSDSALTSSPEDNVKTEEPTILEESKGSERVDSGNEEITTVSPEKEKSEDEFWSELLRSETVPESDSKSTNVQNEVSDVTTEKSTSESVTGRNVPVNEESEETSTDSNSETRSEVSDVEGTTQPSDTANSEPEVVPKIFRSDLEKLNNEKFPLQEENSGSNDILDETSETTTETLETRTENEVSEVRSSESLLTTEVSEEKRKDDDDYWKNMMLGENNSDDNTKNTDNETEKRSESDSDNGEQVTENTIVEGTTALFFRSDLDTNEEPVDNEVVSEQTTIRNEKSDLDEQTTVSNEIESRIPEDQKEDLLSEASEVREEISKDTTTVSFNEDDSLNEIESLFRSEGDLADNEITTQSEQIDEGSLRLETTTFPNVETENKEISFERKNEDSEVTTVSSLEETVAETESASDGELERTISNQEEEEEEEETLPEVSSENKNAGTNRKANESETVNESVAAKAEHSEPVSSESNKVQSGAKEIITDETSQNNLDSQDAKRKMIDTVLSNESSGAESEQSSEISADQDSNKTRRIENQFNHLARKYGLRPLTRKTFREDINNRRVTRRRNKKSLFKRL